MKWMARSTRAWLLMPTGHLYGEWLTMALASHLFKAGASPESVESSLRGSIASNRLKRVIEYINDRPEAI